MGIVANPIRSVTHHARRNVPDRAATGVGALNRNAISAEVRTIPQESSTTIGPTLRVRVIT